MTHGEHKVLIKISNVSFSYPAHANKTVLNIPSWEVEAGTQTFLHGPSGSGKSTLLGLLSGLLVPTKGELSVLDQRLDKMTSRKRDLFRANHIGYVFQQFNLIPYLNTYDNIILASQFSKQKITPRFHQNLKHLLNNLNMDEGDCLRPVQTLSIGQQQRIAIARALINKPQLLIADEPTSSLDSANRDAFINLLIPMVKANNISLLFVSHDLTLSTYFDRVESLEAINQIKASKQIKATTHVY